MSDLAKILEKMIADIEIAEKTGVTLEQAEEVRRNGKYEELCKELWVEV